jgi:DNA-binding NtrC family response regulator
VQSAERFEELLGCSPSMRRLYDILGRVASTPISVLISGESGTGKELVARAIHRRSARHGGPFVAVNCTALPGALIESELFGHVRGAFTDARVDRPGLSAEADGGTLFLDEIGELPAEIQPKLLRALQERAVRRLEADVETPVDVRVLAATNRDLESEIEQGKFRSDLYFRLNVVNVHVPPLRARGNDVLLLAQHFRPERCRPPDVLVSDVRMPGLGGLDVLRGLRHCEWANPVILITAFGDEATHLEAVRLGAAAVLDKPFDVDDLRAILLATFPPVSPPPAA